MSVTFRQVERDEEVEALAHMAYHIWNEYWPAIIGQAQTDYMVEKFQSLNAFRTDIADNGYEYFFIMQHEDQTPHELGAATHGADIHDQGDTVAGRVNDDVESDRDDELAHDTEDFARTAAARPDLIAEAKAAGRLTPADQKFLKLLEPAPTGAAEGVS